MDKSLSTFEDELKSIGQEVAVDVGEILRIAKHNKQPHSKQVKVSASESRAPETEESPSRSSNKESQQQRQVEAKKPAASTDAKVNVTTRLSTTLNDLLSDAALKQRLAKKKPDSRQGIIEEAIHHWLKRNQYM